MSEFIKKSIVWMIVAIMILGTVGTISFGIPSAEPSQNSANISNTVIPAVSYNDRILGGDAAELTVIEYSDFECEFCGSFLPVIKKITEEYDGKVRFVHRNLPLFQVHKNAGTAAKAAEAAGFQGKYWDMAGLLYEKQGEWSALPTELETRQYFMRLAKSLKLDSDTFEADLDSIRVREKINNDITGAFSAGVDRIPAFFIDGEAFSPGNYEEFKSILDSKLHSSKL